jgi:hypothetical protein
MPPLLLAFAVALGELVSHRRAAVVAMIELGCMRRLLKRQDPHAGPPRLVHACMGIRQGPLG